MSEHSDLWFKQLSVGPMANFIYLLGSKRTHECLVVDPAWDAAGLVELAASEGFKVTGALVTHYHPDHVGGDMMGFSVPGGIAELLSKADAKIHVNKLEADGLKQITGVAESDLVRHESGDVVQVGDVSIKLIHTPGHTPGSQCFLVQDRLVSGDTLFVDGCGRVDLPGADPAAMYESLTQKLAKLGDDVVLFPGHDYGGQPTATMGEQKRTNTYLRIRSLEDWLRLMG
ncbi:MAG: MBL fold metallo-hydrolase [Myxococcota bacterium]